MKWALKIAVKLLASRLPLPYAFWRSIGIFRHGRMDRRDYAIKIFDLHMKRAFPLGLPQGATILELGPGDSVASALLGFASGAGRIFLADVGRFAHEDMAFYRAFSTEMTRRGLCAPDISTAKSLEDVLSACNARYLTEGASSLCMLPSESVDFAWSHSVLEHVRKHELGALLGELRRILKPGGLSSHNIDYQDHLDYSLNNLRFSEKVWESAFFARSGFYTNRVPAVQMHAMFKTAGFEVVREAFGRWPALPVPRRSLHRDFSVFPDEALLNRTSHVLLKA
jgi:SAM-dependent methyltransferase